MPSEATAIFRVVMAVLGRASYAWLAAVGLDGPATAGRRSTGTLSDLPGFATIPAVAIKRPGRTRAAILSVACLGMVLEVAQMHIPGRVFEWRNVLANSSGFMVGMLAALPLRLGVAVALLPGLARSSRLAVRE